MRNGKSRQVYMNYETEKKALEVCEKYQVSMSTLIRMALDKYIEGVEIKEER